MSHPVLVRMAGCSTLGCCRSCSQDLAKAVISPYLEKWPLCAWDGMEIFRTSSSFSSSSFTRKDQFTSFVTYRLTSYLFAFYSSLWTNLHRFYSQCGEEHKAWPKLGKVHRSNPQREKCLQSERAESRYSKSLERRKIPTSRQVSCPLQNDGELGGSDSVHCFLSVNASCFQGLLTTTSWSSWHCCWRPLGPPALVTQPAPVAACHCHTQCQELPILSVWSLLCTYQHDCCYFHRDPFGQWLTFHFCFKPNKTNPYWPGRRKKEPR